MSRPRWRQLRAGLIGLVVVLGLVDGCPLPPSGCEPLRRARAVVESPVAWLEPTLMIGQRWAVYQAPGGQRFRMSIEGQDPDGTWRLLFRAADPEHAEDAEILTSAHLEGSWQPTDAAPGQYPAFAQWAAGRALDRHRELIAARVRMEKITIVPGGFTSSGQYVWTHVRLRGGP